MSELTFQEKGHKYFLDGEEIPSVSEVTRFLSREVYGDVDPIALERAAQKGTAIHQLTEKLDREGAVDVPFEYSGYMDAYCKFIDDHKPKWGMIEHMVHMGDNYAGTIDRYGFVDGKPAIVDIKTSKTVSKQNEVVYTAAQNMYRMALEDEGYPVSDLYILHLKPNGRYKLIKLPIDFGLAHSCLTIHQAFKQASIKRKVPVTKNEPVT